MAATLVSRVTDLFSKNLNRDAPGADSATEKRPQGDAEAITVDSPKQPDIAYHPDEVKWKARTARRLAEDPTLLQTPLPEGFPQKLDSPLVWEGKDWKNPSEWEYTLSADHLKEIDDAVHHFNGMPSTYILLWNLFFITVLFDYSLKEPFGHISPATFLFRPWALSSRTYPSSSTPDAVSSSCEPSQSCPIRARTTFSFTPGFHLM
ncbi:hypothetical protein BDZ97DRAFT_461915 [Flammula alnicola]|nr:hypothetical protein BDZ97DRAFT_461915 [Flammula alnicola]